MDHNSDFATGKSGMCDLERSAPRKLGLTFTLTEFSFAKV
jgi:hypothetical protein